MRVSPFRHPWLSGYLPLPMAFRSLSRLSSAPGAKASALCPYQLNLSYGFSCRRLHSVAARAVPVLSLVLLLVASFLFPPALPFGFAGLDCLYLVVFFI